MYFIFLLVLRGAIVSGAPRPGEGRSRDDLQETNKVTDTQLTDSSGDFNILNSVQNILSADTFNNYIKEPVENALNFNLTGVSGGTAASIGTVVPILAGGLVLLANLAPVVAAGRSDYNVRADIYDDKPGKYPFSSNELYDDKFFDINTRRASRADSELVAPTLQQRASGLLKNLEHRVRSFLHDPTGRISHDLGLNKLSKTINSNIERLGRGDKRMTNFLLDPLGLNSFVKRISRAWVGEGNDREPGWYTGDREEERGDKGEYYRPQYAQEEEEMERSGSLMHEVMAAPPNNAQWQPIDTAFH